MPWNPKIYNQFKSIRYKPFFDLVELLNHEKLKNGIDIGCGTGEQTSLLSQKFPLSNFLGIDSSSEMLQESQRFKNEHLDFKISTIEDFMDSDSTWDLIFSNAALQWAENHEALFPKLISKVNKDGQFAVQMPFQKENILNKILIDLVNEEPFKTFLNGFVRKSPLLSIDEYVKIMFDNGLTEINASIRVYPIIAESKIDLYNFISGSSLIPYMELLSEEKQEAFKSAYLKKIKSAFKKYPTIYSFKRMLLYGVKK